MAAATCVIVYRTGGDYFPKYVQKLTAGLKKHGAKDIICLSDDDTVGRYCDFLRLENNWPGWWSKLEIFRLKGKFFYVDLDTLILRNIRPLLNADYPAFTMLRDFNYDYGASGVMAWDGDYSYLMDDFKPVMAAEYMVRGVKWGDQGWINERLKEPAAFFQDRFPGLIVSRKTKDMKARFAATVLCYHGQPRPHITGWKP